MKIILFCVLPSGFWLLQIQVTVRIHHVHSAYSELLSATELPTRVAIKMGCSIYQVLVGGTYNILKDAINKRKRLSDYPRLDTLFGNVGIGEWKPYKVFRYLKKL